jgi:Tetratricopeptide repeat
MQFKVRSQRGQWLLIAVTVAAFALLTVWIAKAYVASVLARNLTVHDLSLATELDPGNATYHIRLGRLYQYSVTDAKPAEALAQFRRAAALDPADPDAWLNLAAALEFQGDTTDAEKNLRRADALAPNLPYYQWTIGNYFLLHGNTQEAFRHFRVVLAGTRQYDATVFSTAWKASGNAAEILQQLIPDGLPAEFSYLDYLVSTARFAEAQPVWERIRNNPERFDPHQAAGYIDTLLNAHQPGQAYQVWSDMQAKGLISAQSDSDDKDLIHNGDFEDDMLHMGFGWRIISVPNVYVGLDTSIFHSPGHSLLVQFTGTQNLDYHGVIQLVKVSPGTSYTLQAVMKTQGITTDSGPRLEVRDAYDPTAMDKLSDELTGTTGGWTPMRLSFKTGPKTELVAVGLARIPSQKFDNQIAGKVWVDDVQLTASPQ